MTPPLSMRKATRGALGTHPSHIHDGIPSPLVGEGEDGGRRSPPPFSSPIEGEEAHDESCVIPPCGMRLGRAAVAVFCVLISMPWEGFLRLVAAESASAPPLAATATNAPPSTASAPASPFTNAVPVAVFHETEIYGVRDPFCPIGYIRRPPLPPGVKTNVVEAPVEVKEVTPKLVVKAIAFGIALLDGGKNLKAGGAYKYTGPDGTVDYKVLGISEDTVTIFCNQKQYSFKVGGGGGLKPGDLIEKPESDQKDPADQLQQFNEKE